MERASKERLKMLAIGLDLFGMSREDMILTLDMVCSSSAQTEALIQWMAAHEGATTAEISDAVVQIVKTVK